MIQFIKDEFKRLQQKLLCKQKEIAEVETELHNLHCHPELAMKEKIRSTIVHIELIAKRQGFYESAGCPRNLTEKKRELQLYYDEINSLLDDLITYLRKSK